MKKLNQFSTIDSKLIKKVREEYGSPVYLYDENLIMEKCKKVMDMPEAFGLQVRFAMKANSNRTILKLIHGQGLHIDASSLNEVKRGVLAGIPLEHIILTTQEVPEGEERIHLEKMMKEGLKYNVCSLRQLHLIGDFASENKIGLSIRIHPGVGSGESASRNTGDDYSCFGVHLSDLEQVLEYGKEKGILFTQVHAHIGSGADPEMWRQNIDTELDIVEKYFKDAKIVSFGGGLKEGRVPGETVADVTLLGNYAKDKIEKFYEKTGRKIKMEIEPGTYIVANSGYIITKVLDKKRTGKNGLNFVIADGGMEVNARPIMYGSRHPFYVVSKNGELISSAFEEELLKNSGYEAALVGRCCESGDSQCLDEEDRCIQIPMGEPEIGDIVVIGGAGAYCSSMTPFNYNSHTQIPEILYTKDGDLKMIRKGQTLEQMLQNEM